MASVRAVLTELLGTSIWEAVAVLLALAYLILAIRRSLWCWLCAFISTAIYIVLMAKTGLVMDTLLQVYYLVMAVYGYLEWRRGQAPSGELTIVSWTWQQHVLAIAAVALATVVNAWLLQFVEISRSPWLDSFVTWASVLTTWMVARRVIENWLYWIVVDTVAACLYYTRGLSATALLFLVYVGMVVHGYLVWRKRAALAVTEVTA
ncbi:MAG: nicotinamide riboside transporter PnuC [Steroidobacteraceae bacterium]